MGASTLCLALLLLAAAPAVASEWTAHPLGGEAAEAQLFGISCPDTSLCVAVGGNNTIAASSPQSRTWRNSTQSTATSG